ncbi:MAG: DUF1206 domain-containing protein [Streptosporangiales bacterium]|jgi:hypothetical protein|nr:DUF1206 domain-containing protein [Streptosporangiales bacterium]
MGYLARAGFLARGVMYVVIGWIALLVAFGKTSQQADRTGALHELSTTPFGALALWLLVIGFFGMALWRLSQAAFGGRGRGAGARLLELGRAVLYAFIGYGVLEYAIGEGSPQSSDQQAVDLTATVMKYPGGRAAVIVAGLAFIVVGGWTAYEAWQRRFAAEFQRSRMSPGARRVVDWLGRFGGIARGIVFVTAGIFLIVAAADADPGQAKGVDSSLRTLAQTPFGPWLLVAVAAGLVMFGLFSCCEARWGRV